MAEAGRTDRAPHELESLGPEELRSLLADVQRRLAQVGAEGERGAVRIRSLGDGKLEAATAAGARAVPPRGHADFAPDPVQPEPGEQRERAAAANTARSVLAMRLSAAGDESVAARVELGGMVAQAARHGLPEALVRTASEQGDAAPGPWNLVARASFEVEVAPGSPVELLVVGRGPFVDPAALARGAFAGLERAGGEA